MAKPILAVSFPRGNISFDEYEKVNKRLGEKLTDWHVITYINSEHKEPNFQSFTVNNADDITLEKLKDELTQLITNNLKK